MKKIQSTCNLCALACNLDFYVENGKIEKVSPTVDYPVNQGFCCIKGLNLDKQQTKIKARKTPLLKDENGNMKEISWEEGFKTFAEKMTAIQEKYGKESVAFISTGQIPTEDMALLGHVGRNYMKINGDGNTRLCMATSVVAHKQSFGFDAPPYTLNDAELSDTIIFIGANPVIAHPVFWGRVRKNTTAKIITIDPRKSETAINSDIWVDIKPKADLVLLYTLANVLIEKKWIDVDYIEKHSEGFEEFKGHVAKFTLENVEEETGKKLYMVDSRSASIGTALLIREAVKLRDAGVNVSDIAAACTEMSKYIKLTAVVGSLKYLKMGGRLSGAAAFAGTMLHITPVVSIEDGKVVVIGKTRGKKAAEKLMHDKLTKDGLSLTRDFMFGHINCSESLETFINKSLTYISDVNGNVCVSSIGCSVGTHVGPGTYGIAYVEAAESGMNRESIVKTA